MKPGPVSLSSITRAGSAVLIDLRSPSAYRRRHLRGAVSVPASRMERSLFLLPPRRRPLLLLGHDAGEAARWAVRLLERGWLHVRWLEAGPRDIDPDLCEGGIEPNRIWEPAQLLKRFEPRLPRSGVACDLACGSGRNAVYLALGGRRAAGLDLLPGALRQGRALARAARIEPPGVAHFHLADLRDPRVASAWLQPGRFSVITCFRYLQRDLLPRIAEALAPGGWLLYETFLERQAVEGRRPRRPSFLLEPGELRRAFASIKCVHWREGRDREGDWTASFVGRR